VGATPDSAVLPGPPQRCQLRAGRADPALHPNILSVLSCVYYTVKLQAPGQPPQAIHRAPHLRLEGRKRVRQLLRGGRGLEEHACGAPALRRRALTGRPPGPRAGRVGRCWASRGPRLRRRRLLRCLGQGALKQAPLC